MKYLYFEPLGEDDKKKNNIETPAIKWQLHQMTTHIWMVYI